MKENAWRPQALPGCTEECRMSSRGTDVLLYAAALPSLFEKM